MFGAPDPGGPRHTELGLSRLSLSAAFLLVGCAEISPIDAEYQKTGCESWAPGDWIGPGEARVVMCDPERLVIQFPGDQADAVIARWRSLLVAQGWAISVDNSDGIIPSVRWEKEERRLVTGIALSSGDTWATVSGAYLDPVAP